MKGDTILYYITFYFILFDNRAVIIKYVKLIGIAAIAMTVYLYSAASRTHWEIAVSL